MQDNKNITQCIINAVYTDKKCRICGYADTNNVHIFDGPNKLLEKIITVYPIILYPNDPLPKNICRKCIYNVNTTYNDMQRLLRTQSKWINNVRTVQPNHTYIKILDLIEHTSNITKNSIQAAFGEDITAGTVKRFLLLDQLNQTNSSKTNAAATTTPNSSQTRRRKSAKSTQSVNRANNSSQSRINCKKGNQKEMPLTCHTVTTRSLTVGNHQPETECIKRPPPPLTVKCRHCPLQFKTLKALAVHQPTHMSLSLTRLYDRKFLAKSARRGRVITVDEKKCIRCLNCWRIHTDNKSILQHWTCGDCDFYCHICGAEFPQTPKMLREHVPAVHGITYRSSKRRNNLSNIIHDESKYIVNEAIGNLKKSANKRCTCEVCGLKFQSFKARNSHMRVHNPSCMFGNLVLPLHSASDAYEEFEPEYITPTNVKEERSGTPKCFADVLPGIATLPQNCVSISNVEQNNEFGSVKVKSIDDLPHDASTTTTNCYDTQALPVTQIKDEPVEVDAYTIKYNTFHN